MTPMPVPVTVPPVLVYDREVAERRREAAQEYLAWAESHARDRRREQARLAQITTHPDRWEHRSVIGQQLAWARRHARHRRLHESGLAQIHHRWRGLCPVPQAS
jgi:hypothetical protein